MDSEKEGGKSLLGVGGNEKWLSTFAYYYIRQSPRYIDFGSGNIELYSENKTSSHLTNFYSEIDI